MIVKLELTGTQYRKLLGALAAPANHFVVKPGQNAQAPKPFIKLKAAKTEDDRGFDQYHALREHHVTLEVEETYTPADGDRDTPTPLAPLLNIYKAIGLFPDEPARSTPSAMHDE